ncbi:hypothetical protein KEM55_004820, partial [Ascosphaera atra]
MSPHVRASRGLLSSLARPSLSASTSRTSTFLPSSQTPASIRLAHGDVPSSAARRAILRRRMEEWLSGPGQVFREPSPYGTNYLTNYSIDGAPIKKDPAQDEAAEGEKAVSADSDATINSLRPFPLNPSFVSQPVLSEELRNQIYKEVVENKKGVRAVSVILEDPCLLGFLMLFFGVDTGVLILPRELGQATFDCLHDWSTESLETFQIQTDHWCGLLGSHTLSPVALVLHSSSVDLGATFGYVRGVACNGIILAGVAFLCTAISRRNTCFLSRGDRT